jgi:two-component system, LytTR family, response regulator
MLKLLIVDDEEEVRELLGILLGSYSDVQVVGSASNVDEAVKITLDKKPDVVFLDISMPGRDGFAYISEMESRSLYPGIIFVTAFENYAIKAIKSAAFDYLLKPVGKQELFDALDRFSIIKARNKQTDYSELAELLTKSKTGRIRLNTRTGYFFVDPEDVVYCEADGNYSHITLINGKNEITTMNLGNLEKMLEKYEFFRISRSFIINLKYLARVDRRQNVCEMEYNGLSQHLKVPAQKIKLLEAYF